MSSKEQAQNENLVIYDYYNGLDNEAKNDFRDLVMKRLEISMPTFYNRLRRSKFKSIEREWIINDIINRQC
ncbi:hypothetical protein [uncultured Duncaniella sp.]|uniref:hypothetical protein n=1 Tax=uncultured Duncaniella sp. TaxID=2768039 RepID=UPI0025A64F67|nr:hypothetical protein [uncultured Duncaniella sp.]